MYANKIGVYDIYKAKELRHPQFSAKPLINAIGAEINKKTCVEVDFKNIDFVDEDFLLELIDGICSMDLSCFFDVPLFVYFSNAIPWIRRRIKTIIERDNILKWDTEEGVLKIYRELEEY
jgi:hypothetical protein